MRRKQGYFSISAVAKMFSVHQQTIRLYEKEGLINPKRSSGNTRMFTEEDVDKLEEIIHLTHQLGINLAGVEMILRLQKQIKKMQRDMNKMFKQAQTELSQENNARKQTIQAHAQQLLKLKNTPEKSSEPPQKSEGSDTVESEDWKIDYDDQF